MKGTAMSTNMIASYKITAIHKPTHMTFMCDLQVGDIIHTQLDFTHLTITPTHMWIARNNDPAVQLPLWDTLEALQLFDFEFVDKNSVSV